MTCTPTPSPCLSDYDNAPLFVTPLPFYRLQYQPPQIPSQLHPDLSPLSSRFEPYSRLRWNCFTQRTSKADQKVSNSKEVLDALTSSGKNWYFHTQSSPLREKKNTESLSAETTWRVIVYEEGSPGIGINAIKFDDVSTSDESTSSWASRCWRCQSVNIIIRPNSSISWPTHKSF